MIASLKVDIKFSFLNQLVTLKAGDEVIVDVQRGIAYHAGSDQNFDIDTTEYSANC